MNEKETKEIAALYPITENDKPRPDQKAWMACGYLEAIEKAKNIEKKLKEIEDEYYHNGRPGYSDSLCGLPCTKCEIREVLVKWEKEK
jgi:hypothetical protein